MKYNLINEIYDAGEDILESSFFQQSKTIEQHYHTNLAIHSINVAMKSLKISDKLSKIGVKIHREEMIRGCLLHDLGLLDRDGFYKCGPHQALMHGKKGVSIAKEIVGDLTPIEKQIIERHMFPLYIIPTTKIEGHIVQIADKICAVQELCRKKKCNEFEESVFNIGLLNPQKVPV